MLWITPEAIQHWTVAARTTHRRAMSLAPLPMFMPEGPLDILIDNTGLQVFGAGQ